MNILHTYSYHKRLKIAVQKRPLVLNSILVVTITLTLFSGGGGATSTQAAPAAAIVTCQQVVWTNTVNVTATGNSLQKTGGASSTWDAGASSTQAIQSGDGYALATVDDTTTYKLFGLSNGDSNPTQTDVNFALFMAGGTLKVYENGALRGNFGAYAVGDDLKVAVEGGAVKYYLNATLLYTSATAPVYPLLVDTSINSLYGRITNVYICDSGIGGKATNTPTSTRTNTPIGAPTNTPTNVPTATNTPAPDCEPAVWTNRVNVIAIGNSLQKIGGLGSSWDAGAASTRAIQSGDGYARATADDLTTYKLFGLSNGDSDPTQIDVNFALFMAGSTLKVYENGTLRGNFGAYAVGDDLKVAIEGGAVKYYRNTTLLYTSATAPTYPLRIDTSINSLYGRITNASICGALGSIATSTPATTFTPTSTHTGPSATETATATATAPATLTPTSSHTPAYTKTSTSTPSATQSLTPTFTHSSTTTSTRTPTPAFTSTFTPTPNPQPPTSTATPTVTPQSTAGIVWSADMETGNLNQWITCPGQCQSSYDSGACTRPTNGVSTEQSHTGNYSMKVTINTSRESGCRQFRSVESKTGNTYYYSAWLYLPAATSAASYWNIFQFKSNHCNIEEPFWVIDLMPRTSSLMYLRLRYKGGNEEVPGPFYGDPGGRTVHFGQTISDVVPGQWTHIEFYLNQSSGLPLSAGQAAYDGELRVWQDGVELWHFSQAMTKYPTNWAGCSTPGDQRWSLNNYSDGLSPNPATLYWDDAVISVNRIGP